MEKWQKKRKAKNENGNGTCKITLGQTSAASILHQEEALEAVRKNAVLESVGICDVFAPRESLRFNDRGDAARSAQHWSPTRLAVGLLQIPAWNYARQKYTEIHQYKYSVLHTHTQLLVQKSRV